MVNRELGCTYWMNRCEKAYRNVGCKNRLNPTEMVLTQNPLVGPYREWRMGIEYRLILCDQLSEVFWKLPLPSYCDHPKHYDPQIACPPFGAFGRNRYELPQPLIGSNECVRTMSVFLPPIIDPKNHCPPWHWVHAQEPLICLFEQSQAKKFQAGLFG